MLKRVAVYHDFTDDAADIQYLTPLLITCRADQAGTGTPRNSGVCTYVQVRQSGLQRNNTYRHSTVAVAQEGFVGCAFDVDTVKIVPTTGLWEYLGANCQVSNIDTAEDEFSGGAMVTRIGPETGTADAYVVKADAANGQLPTGEADAYA